MNTNTNNTNQQECCGSSCGCETPAATRRAGNAWSYVPQIDVIEHADRFEIACDAPGLDAQSIELSYEQGMLSLHGTVPPRFSDDTAFLRQEYGVGDFDREIPLGNLAERIDADHLSAGYANGVVSITLPKAPKAQARRIAVTTT